MIKNNVLTVSKSLDSNVNLLIKIKFKNTKAFLLNSLTGNLFLRVVVIFTFSETRYRSTFLIYRTYIIYSFSYLGT